MVKLNTAFLPLLLLVVVIQGIIGATTETASSGVGNILQHSTAEQHDIVAQEQHQHHENNDKFDLDRRGLFWWRRRRSRRRRPRRRFRPRPRPAPRPIPRPVPRPPPPAPVQRRTILEEASDDFEDPSWSFDFRDEESSNGKWHDGLRALPSVIRRVPTPPGGRPGSTGSLLLRARPTSSRAEQNDFLSSPYPNTIGYNSLSKDDLPLVSVNFYIPNFRSHTSNSFAMRLQVLLPDGRRNWPGIIFQSRGSSATLLARTSRGDVPSKRLSRPGWHTLAMGLDRNGSVVYYHRAGAVRNRDISSRDVIARSFSNVKLEVHWFGIVAYRGRASPNIYVDNVELSVVD